MENPRNKKTDKPSFPFTGPEFEPDQSELTAADNSIEALLPQLDFYETAELREARQAILMALREESDDPVRRRKVWTEYAIIGEHMVDDADQTGQNIAPRAKAQIALIIHKALIFREAGQVPRYIQELDCAETYADAKRFYAVASTLEAELEAVVSSAELSPESFLAKLKGEISEMNRDFLRRELEDGAELGDVVAAASDMLHTSKAALLKSLFVEPS